MDDWIGDKATELLTETYTHRRHISLCLALREAQNRGYMAGLLPGAVDAYERGRADGIEQAIAYIEKCYPPQTHAVGESLIRGLRALLDEPPREAQEDGDA